MYIHKRCKDKIRSFKFVLWSDVHFRCVGTWGPSMDLGSCVRVWYWVCSIGVMFYFNINFTVHSVDIVVGLFLVADTIDTIDGFERGWGRAGGESSLCYMYDP